MVCNPDVIIGELDPDRNIHGYDHRSITLLLFILDDTGTSTSIRTYEGCQNIIITMYLLPTYVRGTKQRTTSFMFVRSLENILTLFPNLVSQQTPLSR